MIVKIFHLKKNSSKSKLTMFSRSADIKIKIAKILKVNHSKERLEKMPTGRKLLHPSFCSLYLLL